jgi:mannose-6-phosphate isomerase-like protein (cupin superfamily)
MITAMLALAAPTSFEVWTASQQAAVFKQLPAKLTSQHVAGGPLGNWGNHSMTLYYRTGDGEAELHETQNDIFVVQKGTATLIAGGTVVNGKTTAPNEIRGPSIKGGEKRVLGPGDVVHIPAKTPHQTLVAPGQTFSYLVVKIDAQ